MEIIEIQKNVNALLQNDWVKILALPSFGGLYLFFKYFLERKIEGKPDAENISQLNQLADLKEKLDKNGMTLEELQSFRAKALGKSANIAIITAQKYTDAASQLVSDAEKAEHDPDWEQALTQTDMNLLSMKKAAQADDELAAIVNRKFRELDGDDCLILQQSQSAWESFREMETTRESRRWEGGTIRPLMVNLKYEAITRERIAGLSAEEKIEVARNLAVKIPTTPRNLLQHIFPSVPKKRVQDILGTPSFVLANHCYYRYEETQVEISFNHEDAIDDVIVILLHDRVYSGSSPAFLTDIPLGKLTLADILACDDQLEVDFRDSLRTQEIYVCGRSGPPGAWTYFCFGALSVFSGVGLLQETQFEWDKEAGCLRTDPKDILINWMALPSSSLDAPYFDWFIK
ncbi:lysozyme inhibitor LprI family protein [Ralstonia pseudosolanacearum]|uniref:Lysozyme inhibitor LprI-like N-terminal domain-containing protein n=1 Tax=Ralstonia solanacearum TaxID=305 RepID=A0A0S4WZD8_RALSL|nr:protein of unknown function [Ralstonia solanacearum]